MFRVIKDNGIILSPETARPLGYGIYRLGYKYRMSNFGLFGHKLPWEKEKRISAKEEASKVVASGALLNLVEASRVAASKEVKKEASKVDSREEGKRVRNRAGYDKASAPFSTCRRYRGNLRLVRFR